jgi:hypothetical protein
VKDKSKPTKAQEEGTPKVHPALEGLDIRVNALGEIEWNRSRDDVHKFLNQHHYDKKLAGRLGYKSDPDDDTPSFMY